jgi:hypothetical protein
VEPPPQLTTLNDGGSLYQKKYAFPAKAKAGIDVAVV